MTTSSTGRTGINLYHRAVRKSLSGIQLFKTFIFAWIPAFAGMTLLHAGLFVGEGATSLPSMKIPTSARAVGLGGAFSSIDGDVSALEYNPAGLVNINRTDFLASYASYIEDTSLQSFSVGFPIRFDNLAVADPEDNGNRFIENRMGVGLQYRSFTAKDTERTNTGVKLGDFDIRDQVLNVGAAYPLNARLALGATGKYIGSKIQNETANTFAFDGGLQFKIDEKWSLGGSVLNMGSGKAYVEKKDPLPTTAQVGVNRKAKNLLVSLEASEGRDEIIKEALGVEYGLGTHVKLRGGIYNGTNLEFSGGLGVRFQGPQKAPVLTAPRQQPIARANRSQTGPLLLNGAVADQGFQNLVKKLVGQYTTLENAITDPMVAVLPVRADNPDVGSPFSSLLTRHVIRSNAFNVVEDAAVASALREHREESPVEIGGALNCDLVLVSGVEQVEGAYLLNARLFDVKSGVAQATAYEELSDNVFKESKPSIGNVRASPEENENRPLFSRTEIGLDYAVSTRNEFGVVHTVSLRILY
jgi:hypothetical protein